jgi:glycosyltransferase involved in cell wall biosynthesis
MIHKLVSIIMPVYNREHLLRETLSSVLGQTYAHWECIVVDDGSTDETREIAKEFAKKDSRIIFFSRPLNRQKGANSCRNFGFEQSKGDYIQWFDSDDIMHSEKIALQIECLLDSDADFSVCSGVEFVNNINNTSRKWDNIYDDTPIVSHITGKISLHTNGPLFKRDFLKGKKMFNESLQRKQEWEFYTRLLFQSINYIPLQTVLYYFRIHESSINGIDSPKTLQSRVRANILVYEEIKSHRNFLKNNSFLRKHFFDKFIFNVKLALQLGDKKSVFYAFKGVFKTLNFSILKKSVIAIIEKPYLVLSLFKKPNNDK